MGVPDCTVHFVGQDAVEYAGIRDRVIKRLVVVTTRGLIRGSLRDLRELDDFATVMRRGPFPEQQIADLLEDLEYLAVE